MAAETSVTHIQSVTFLAVAESNGEDDARKTCTSHPQSSRDKDDTGDTHVISQGEGRQGDPPRRLLFSLGQHAALQSLRYFLRRGEHFFAYLDDLYVVCYRERVGPIFTRLEEDLESHARILQVH